MRKLLFFAFFLLTLIFCSIEQPDSYSPKFTASKKSLFSINEKQDYIFGYLEVPENRAYPKRKTIKLPVYIFKSRSPNPQKDPIIYTVGGPGSTTMPSAQFMAYYSYLDDRDFILFEQRGTSYAQPHLDCPEWSKAFYMSNMPEFEQIKSDSLFEKAVYDCRSRLVQKGIDLNAYNTNEIAADIEDLRISLGIEKYNLLTISYSTKIAQVLMRDYPEPIRSVVMDSPLPLAINYDEESNQNLLLSIDKLLSDCASDVECNLMFPELKKRFFRFLREKTDKPLEVVIINPKNGGKELFKLRGKDLVQLFTNASTTDIPTIPFEIEKLLGGDYSSLKEQLSQVFEKPGNGAGIGMRLSVWCAEELPFASQKTIKKERNKYPEIKGLKPSVFNPNICKIWNVANKSKIENQPISSSIPTLLISGEYDNETPVKWAKQMGQELINSHHLIFKGWKHTPTTNWSNLCAMTAAKTFFNNPKIKPGVDCLQGILRPKFKTEK